MPPALFTGRIDLDACRVRAVIALDYGDPTTAVWDRYGGARLGRSLALPFSQSVEYGFRRDLLPEVDCWRRFAPWLATPTSGLSTCAERTPASDVRFALDKTGGRGSVRAANRHQGPSPPNRGRRSLSMRRQWPRSPGCLSSLRPVARTRLSTCTESEHSHRTVETPSEEREGEAPTEPRTVILIPIRRIGVAVADL